MTPVKGQKKGTPKDNGAKIEESTNVLTVRIDNNLNNILNNLSENLRMSKANIVRNYLEMAKFLIIDKGSIKSLNNRDFIIVKRSFLRSMIKELPNEIDQIDLGGKLARFVNDIARIKGYLDNIEFKLDLCEHLGFFPKFIDAKKYILITNKFGPQKFVESFMWQMIKKTEFNPNFIESELKKNKSLRASYNKTINPVDRSSSHFSYEFAKLPET